MTAGRLGIDGDALEAVAFAILGYQMLRGEPGNIASVTGARSPAILGKLTLPPPLLHSATAALRVRLMAPLPRPRLEPQTQAGRGRQADWRKQAACRVRALE